MNRSMETLFLEEVIGLLVRHFGIETVKAALAKVTIPGAEETNKSPKRPVLRSRKPTTSIVITNALGSIRESDPEKYRLLGEFYKEAKNRRVLPDSEDIRQFAQLIGLKEIEGKSRKDMIPKLMRFLLDQPTDRLRIDLGNAKNISEQKRQEGFSILTDKLLGER